MNDLYFCERDSAHWEAAWAWLESHPLNDGLKSPIEAECPDTGEVWQYLGTERHEGRWFDCFRHRHHPMKRERVYVRRPLPTNPLTGEVT